MTAYRRTRRWRGVVGVALVLVAAGLLFKRPAVLLAGTVGVAFAAYPRLTGTPSLDIAIERRVSDARPGDGDRVDVTVTVRNAAKRPLADLRVVDGVPPMLTVTGGSPRRALALRPGGTARFSYAVRAAHGTHEFEPATVIARDAAGAIEVETTVATETTLECVDEVPADAITLPTTPRIGPTVTDRGGSGIEFHGTRTYRRGDPMNRVDWRRFARTGELTTVEYHRHRAAAVVLWIDAREAAYRASAGDEPHAVSYAQAAAIQLVSAMGGRATAVGVAVVGRDTGWVAPGSGPDHAARVRRRLVEHPALSAQPPTGTADARDVSTQVADLRSRLGADTQVLHLSPLTDEVAARTTHEIAGTGTPVTVISPDVTATGTAGEQVAAIERRNRIDSLRSAGLPIVDWQPPERLGTALATAGGLP